jgi:hypothetical protein
MTNATLLRTQVTPNDCGIWRGVAAHCGLIARTPDRGGGYPGVCVRRVEVASLTLYHPHVASDGGICVLQLDAESLDLVLSGQ